MLPAAFARESEREAVLSKCILIVDDSERIRASLRIFLERDVGIEVCGEAVDGLDAVEKVTRLQPDLVILDLVMPRMNGLQAARELKSMPAHTRIILFTMHSDAIQSREAEEAGIDAVVAKSNLVALRQNIDSLLAEQ